MNLKEKMLAVLDEGVKYYSEDVNRRCTDGIGCFYDPKRVGKEGISEGCFIGRKMTPQQKSKAPDSIITDPDFPAACIPKEFKGLPILFLRHCQLLHDVGSNWNSVGLSLEGKQEVNKIKMNIVAGKYV